MDFWMHVITSMGLCVVIYYTLCLFIDRNAAYFIALCTVLCIGLLKELSDSFIDSADLVANLLGVLLVACL